MNRTVKVKVRIPDRTGDTTLLANSVDELNDIVKKHSNGDKFFFQDGVFIGDSVKVDDSLFQSTHELFISDAIETG